MTNPDFPGKPRKLDLNEIVLQELNENYSKQPTNPTILSFNQGIVFNDDK